MDEIGLDWACTTLSVGQQRTKVSIPGSRARYSHTSGWLGVRPRSSAEPTIIMPNGFITVGGQTYNWATSTHAVSEGSSKLRKALAEADDAFFQKSVDYIDDADSPKSKTADPTIGRCDKQPGVGHLAWQIGTKSYGDLKFDATSAHRLTVATASNRTSILVQLFTISNSQKFDLDIT
jgi:hypothetical protein